MTVGSFDPQKLNQSLDVATVRALLQAAGHGAEPLQLANPDEFVHLITHAGWAQIAGQFSDDELLALIRIFTVGEGQFAGWQADAKSAVIPLVAEMKSRGSYSKDTTRWIKAHTDNRFLPHGNLLDRL